MRHLGLFARARRVVAVGLAIVLCESPIAAFSQSTPGSLQSILQSIGQSQGGLGGLGTSPQSQVPQQPAPSSSVMSPATANTALLPVSRLELLFSQRAGQPLHQYGYETFGLGSSVVANQLGAVQDSYILGPGDQLSIVNRGHDNSAYTVTVDRDGRIIIPNIEPIMAAGRTFGDVRGEIVSREASGAFGSKAFISLASARQISVVVSGEVNAPGVRTLSGLNSPIDAILLSGGIRKTGSLRNILIEHNGTSRHIDLYALMTGGNVNSLAALTEGDRIVVPPIGNTVAAIGMVKRPAIYELAPGTSQISASTLLRMAGGIEIAGNTHLTKIGLLKDGHTQLSSLTHYGVIRAGEILSVDQSQSSALGRVTLVGDVQVPGTRSLSEASTISRLIKDGSELSPDAYTPFGLIIHRNQSTNFRTVSAFSPKRVFEKAEDPSLANDDTVVIFSRSQIQALAAAAANNMSIANANLTSGLQMAQQNTTQTAIAQTQQPQPPAASAPSLQQGTTGAGAQAQLAAGLAGGGANTSSLTPAQQAALAQQTGVLSPDQTNYAAQQGYAITAAPVDQSSLLSGAATQSAATTSPSAAQNGTAPSRETTDPRLLAAMSQANPAAAALLQSQNANANNMTLTGGLTSPSAFSSASPSLSPDVIAAQLGLTTQALLRIAQDYLVWVQGEVRDPGPYLAEGGTSLQAMLDAAGGIQRQADLSWVEVTSTDIDPLSGTSRTTRNAYKGSQSDFQTVALRPLDSIRVRQVYSDRDNGIVTVGGEVRYPGDFNITRGEKLSSVLARAGGVLSDGYAYGAVFLRKSAAAAEAENFEREARQIESSITVAAVDPNARASLGYLDNLAQEVRKQPPLGRITVTADPAVLAVKPQRDIILEPGDQIFIPKRPSTVAVAGEVLNASAFQYRPNLNVDDYISLAGGTTQAADEGLTFIIYPDGSASPVDKSWLSFAGSRPIPPGSTIFVPRDPAPFNTTVFLTNVTDILSKLAITAASLAVIGNK